MEYPAPLVPGSRIALTAISAGVPAAIHPRLDRVIGDMKQRGFEIIEGDCLRETHKHVSAPARHRAAEFMRFACDETIDAIAPPWGGELAMELLPLINFQQLRQVRPKWVFGFSDVSTLTAVLTAQCQWATVHSANFIDLVASQTDLLTARTLDWMTLKRGQSFTQHASDRFQTKPTPFEDDPAASLNLTEPTHWKILTPTSDTQRPNHTEPVVFEGRLIGGCLDTLGHLFNTPWLDLPALARAHGDARLLLYVENVELTPAQLARTLLALKFRGVFDNLAGLLIGRNAGPDSDSGGLSDLDVLRSVLSDLDCPVVFDVDIGHRPPNLTLINGARARVEVRDGQGLIEQTLA